MLIIPACWSHCVVTKGLDPTKPEEMKLENRLTQTFWFQLSRNELFRYLRTPQPLVTKILAVFNYFRESPDAEPSSKDNSDYTIAFGPMEEEIGGKKEK